MAESEKHLLTADDVAKKRFTPVRLREGYEMGEVDSFLDDVEAALRVVDKEVVRREVYAELHEDFQATLEERAEKLAAERLEEAQQAFAQEREELQSEIAALETASKRMKHELDETKVALARTEAERAQASLEAEHGRVIEVPVEVPVLSEEEAAPGIEAAEELTLEAAQDAEDRVPVFRVETVEEASRAAVRLLELATVAHDDMLAEAQERAAALIAEGEAQLQELEDEATARIEELEASGNARLAEIEASGNARQEELDSRYHADKANFEAKLAQLKELEAELRSRLTAYLSEKLDSLTNEEPITVEVDEVLAQEPVLEEPALGDAHPETDGESPDDEEDPVGMLTDEAPAEAEGEATEAWEDTPAEESGDDEKSTD